MEYYSVKEAAEKLKIPTRRLSEWINKIEETTPHQFGRMFRGRYFMGNPKKEKVISSRDYELLGQLCLEMENQHYSKLTIAVDKIFN